VPGAAFGVLKSVNQTGVNGRLKWQLRTGRSSGRVLVYCAMCRENYRDYIGKSIPLELVSKEVFLELYRTNRTSSDPQTAVEIVFGKDDFNLVCEAMRLLSLQSNAETNAC
jgi:hypothetical protein